MKRNSILVLTVTFVLALACFGCSQQASQDEGQQAADETAAAQDETTSEGAAAEEDAAAEPEGTQVAVSGQPGSLLAVHEALGQDLSAITEASYDACTTCHAWDTVVSKTDAYWEGLCQITDANPHESHATNAFACSDCHTMAEPQVNVCNQCHIFETPEGWVEKDKTTATYGITATEPAF